MTDQPTERVASELVERIARALFVREFGEPTDWEKWEHLMREYRAQATAILPILQSELAAQQAAIVAWLRSEWGKGSEEAAELAAEFADAIERGEHLPSPPAIEAHKEGGHG